MSNSETILFYKGLARRPRDVISNLLPWKVKRRWQREFSRIRQIRLKDIFKTTDATPLGVATKMPKVVRATRIALVAYALGLLAVGVSVFLDGASQVMEEYNATAAFIIAWNTFKFGVWKDEEAEPRWIGAMLMDSSKAFGVLITLAIIGHVLESAQAHVQAQ